MQPREIVDIIEIIFYVPALVLSVWCCKKHGGGRQLGWFYLIVLALLRIIGASTGIASVHNPTNSNLTATWVACDSIGLGPLLLALQGFLKRLNEGMRRNGLNPQYIQMLSALVCAAVALAIVAACKLYSSDADTASDGQDFQKAAIIVYLVTFLLLAALAAFTAMKRQHIYGGEQRLLWAALLSLPFLLIRIIYSICAAFDNSSTTFSLISDAHTPVAVWAIMSVLMEFIVVSIYLAAGLTLQVIPRQFVRGRYAIAPSYGLPTEQYVFPPGNGVHPTSHSVPTEQKDQFPMKSTITVN